MQKHSPWVRQLGPDILSEPLRPLHGAGLQNKLLNTISHY